MPQQTTFAESQQAMIRLWRLADDAFKQMARQYQPEVSCRIGCADCCRALFDVGPSEALHLAVAYVALADPLREQIRQACLPAQEQYAAAIRGLAEADDSLIYLSRARVCCPLLHDEQCRLHASRPLTCRLYGVPALMGGHIRSCPLSGFKPGLKYPVIDYDRLQAVLRELDPMAAECWPALQSSRLSLAAVLLLAEEHISELKSFA